MTINLTRTIGRILPGKLEHRLQVPLQTANRILSGEDESSVSQRTALTVFVIRVFSAIIAFLSQVLLARWLGEFEYGVFVAVWVGIIVLGTLASIGFPSASIRFVAEYREKRETAHLHGVIRTSVGIVVLSSTLIAATGAFILYNYSDLVTQYYVIPIYLAAICLPMLSMQGVLDGVARAFNWPKVAFLPTYIMRPLAIIGVMGIALLLGFPATAETTMWSAIIATYGSSLFQFFVLFAKFRKVVKPAKPAYQVRNWILIALPIFFVEGFYVLLTSIDILFVSLQMKPEDTAVYFASTKILALVHFVYFAVKAAVSHRYSAYHTSGELEKFRAFVQKTVVWTFWPSLTLALVMALFGKYFLILFGPGFEAGKTLIWVLAAGIVLRASVGPAEALLVMAGRQKACATIYAATLGINIVLNLSLIPFYGLMGAAIATTVSLAYESAALHAVAKRTLGIHAFIIPQRAPVPDAKGVA